MIMGCIFLSCGIFDSNNDTAIIKLYVCLQAQNQVAIYNTPELKLLKLIDLDYSSEGNTPHFVTIDEVNNFWFVTGLDGGYVAQFNLMTDEFIDTISIGSNPALMTIDPMNKTLFCSRMNMSDMPGMGAMGGMDNMEQTNIISEVHYRDNELSLGREFILDSNVLHGITYDYDSENIIRENASPRHVPHKIYEVTDIPYTMNGKRVEGVARWVLEGKDVPNLSSISNPECLKQYSELNSKKAL